MYKEDNDWSIDVNRVPGEKVEIEINNTTYQVSEDVACLSHCFMLLVDAINDKSLRT